MIDECITTVAGGTEIIVVSLTKGINDLTLSMVSIEIERRVA